MDSREQGCHVTGSVAQLYRRSSSLLAHYNYQVAISRRRSPDNSFRSKLFLLSAALCNPISCLFGCRGSNIRKL